MDYNQDGKLDLIIGDGYGDIHIFHRSGPNDNPILAVAAYNGGPTNVRRWLRRSSVSDIDHFLETIPYPETCSHVRKVFRTYQQYKDLWRS